MRSLCVWLYVPAISGQTRIRRAAYNQSHCSSWGVSFHECSAHVGELRRSAFSEERLRTRRVKDELRDNLVARLREKGDASVFPGIVGYDDTVVPQIINAILSRHNF